VCSILNKFKYSHALALLDAPVEAAPPPGMTRSATGKFDREPKHILIAIRPDFLD
jgi:hypothetical protein